MQQRKKIRDYIEAKLKAALPLGGRVFMHRPSPAMIEELPCAFAYFERENIEVLDGDKYNVDRYLRTLVLSVEVATYESLDHVDALAEHVEFLLFQDWFLGKDLTGWDSETTDGLCEGLSLSSCEPYEVVTESSATIYGQKLSFELPYVQDIRSTRKLKKFTGYEFDIVRPEGGVDPVLLSGEVQL